MKVVLLASLMAFFTIVCGYGLQAEALELLSGWPVEFQEKSNMVPIGPKINYFRADDQAHIVFALPGSGIRCYNLRGELEWAKEYSRAVYDVSIWGRLVAFTETDWDQQTFSVHLLSLLDLEQPLGWPRSFPLPTGTCPVAITLYDVNADNAPEVFFSLYHDTLVYGLDQYGNALAGWPVRLQMDLSKGYSLAVGDIDNDGEADILALGTESIQVFTSSGEMKAGFPVRWSEESFTNVAAPVVMDLDGDGYQEIIVATFGIDPYHGTVRVYQWNGTNLWNYEIEADYFHSPVAVFSYNEVTYIAVETGRGRLHLLNQEGQLQPGWPVQKIGHGDGLAAVEIYGEPTVISGCNLNVNYGGELESYLYFHTLDGTQLPGTPLKLKGFTNFAVPTFFDSLMVVTSFRIIFPQQEAVNSVHLFKGDFSAHHWPMYGHDPQNTNNYHSREVEVSVEAEPLPLPQEFALYQNYPNPFNTSTTIQYQLPLTTNHSPLTVRLEIYDLLGRKVATLVDGKQGTANRVQGIGSVIWEAWEVSSGVYFYTLTAGNTSRVRHMTVLK